MSRPQPQARAPGALVWGPHSLPPSIQHLGQQAWDAAPAPHRFPNRLQSWGEVFGLSCCSQRPWRNSPSEIQSPQHAVLPERAHGCFSLCTDCSCPQSMSELFQHSPKTPPLQQPLLLPPAVGILGTCCQVVVLGKQVSIGPRGAAVDAVWCLPFEWLGELGAL